MNILFVSSLYPAYPGHSIKEISYALHNFVKYWIKDHKVVVIRPYFIPSKKIRKYKNFFILDNVKVYNIPVYRLPRTKIYFPYKINKLLQKINYIPDKVIAHMSDSFIWMGKIAEKYGADYIIGIHNSDLRRIKSYENIIDNTYKIACRSKPIKQRFLKIYPKYENKIFVANSGINKAEIESKEFFKNKINSWKNKEKIRFITVSLLQKLKNIDVNINVLANLKKYNWEYIIIGDGEEKENLEKLVDKKNLKERVKFLGMKERKEVLEYLKYSDVFMMISSPETFGLAYLEAMAKGNIIIGAKGWGIDGIIKNEYNGFLVEPRNEKSLKKILEKIINSDYSFKERIIHNMYNTILNLTEEKVSKNYLENIK
ncbi:hypothetical protein X275_00650 [Marinitoga sp. 1197]|uniref:glycosyltransferase n=1 Tax=Marinitoga sp. 1197 TaxID=1428449 RepID=UPI0006595D89|nr:glycosyltransferase [Marinitoga sp. 1197]KLO24340.1 hypothetical protein X275_00650 [Marinitoga sp. 1197]